MVEVLVVKLVRARLVPQTLVVVVVVVTITAFLQVVLVVQAL